MRELREFRAHHDELVAAGITVAGVSRDTVDSNRHWRERLALPYPLLSDREGAVGRALGALRSVRVAGWTIEYLRRTTLLARTDGIIAAVWGTVKIRGHAREVLETARALELLATPPPPGRSSP